LASSRMRSRLRTTVMKDARPLRPCLEIGCDGRASRAQSPPRIARRPCSIGGEVAEAETLLGFGARTWSRSSCQAGSGGRMRREDSFGRDRLVARRGFAWCVPRLAGGLGVLAPSLLRHRDISGTSRSGHGCRPLVDLDQLLPQTGQRPRLGGLRRRDDRRAAPAPPPSSTTRDRFGSVRQVGMPGANVGSGAEIRRSGKVPAC
jgi:hypothetical protein